MRGISREFAEKGTGFADSGGFHVGEVDGYGEDENFPIGDVADFARETGRYGGWEPGVFGSGYGGDVLGIH